MAKVDIKTARPFQLGSVPFPRQVPDASPIFDDLSNAFMKEATEIVEKESFDRGLDEQTNSPNAVEEKSGFLGMRTNASEAYNKGARLAFLSQKQVELDKSLSEIYRSNFHNPAELDKKTLEFRNQFISSVPQRYRSEVLLKTNEKIAAIGNKANEENFKLDIERQSAVITTRITDLNNEISSLALDYSTNRSRIEELKRDRDELLAQATGERDGVPLISPKAAAAYKDNERESTTINAVMGEFSKLKTIEEKEEFRKSVLSGFLKTPDTSNSDTLVDKIIGVESGGKADAKNPNSSATGAGQFIEATWLDMMGKYAPQMVQGKSREEILALRNDPALSRDMTIRYAEENKRKLSEAGITPTDSNVYLAHFLGPAGAIDILKKDDGQQLNNVLPSTVLNANPFLKGKSVGDLKEWSANKMGDGSSQPGISEKILGKMSGGVSYRVSEKMANEIEQQMNRELAAAKAARKEQLSRYEDDMTNKIVAYEKTGVGRDEIVRGIATGVNLGSDKINDFAMRAEAADIAFGLANSDDMTAERMQVAHDDLRQRMVEGEVDPYRGMLITEAIQKQIDARRKAEEDGTIPEYESARGRTANPIVPHDFSNPDMAKDARYSRTAVTSDPSQIISADDVKRFKNEWEVADLGERRTKVEYIKNLTNGDPKLVNSVVKRVAKEQPSVALMMKMAASDNMEEQNAFNIILEGRTWLDNNKGLIRDEAGIKRVINSKITSIVPDRTGGRGTAAYNDLVWSAYAKLSLDAGIDPDEKDYDEGILDSAVALVFGTDDMSMRTGVGSFDIIPYKYGASVSEMEDEFKDFTDTDLIGMNGGANPVDDRGIVRNASWIYNHSKLVPLYDDGEGIVYGLEYRDSLGNPKIIKKQESRDPFIVRFGTLLGKVEYDRKWSALGFVSESGERKYDNQPEE